MLKTQQSHQILNPRDYSHVDYGTIERHNSLIKDYEKLMDQKDALANSVAEREKTKVDRYLKLILFAGVLMCLSITLATGSLGTGLLLTFIAAMFGGGGFITSDSFNGVKVDGQDQLRTIETKAVNLSSKINTSRLSIDRSEASARESLFKRNAQHWLDMSGWEFEKQVARLYGADGYSVVLTKGSSDGGVDLFLKKDGSRYAVQCKNHKKPIGPASIRDLYGAMRHERVRNGIFISSGGYTSGAKDFAKDKPIELLDVSDVIALHKRLATS